MTQPRSLPNTFAGFPAHDFAAAPEADIAVIGVPYLSPYPVPKSYDSQNAPAAIRKASVTYRKTDHYDFDFDGSLLGNPPLRCVDYGDIIRGSEAFDDYARSVTQTVRQLLTSGTVPVVIGATTGPPFLF